MKATGSNDVPKRFEVKKVRLLPCMPLLPLVQLILTRTRDHLVERGRTVGMGENLTLGPPPLFSDLLSRFARTEPFER